MAEPLRLSRGGSSGKKTEVPKTPAAEEVQQFHTNADTDSDTAALHHTLGPGQAQAAPGDHTHDGGSSAPLWNGTTISGTRGTAAYYASLEAALVAKGVTVTATGP